MQPRIIRLRYKNHVLQVPFLIQDNILRSLRRDGARQDVFNMLKILKANQRNLPNLRRVAMLGFFPGTNKVGNLRWPLSGDGGLWAEVLGGRSRG